MEIPRNQLVAVTGRQRLGQVDAGLRRAVRRGPAALPRLPAHLRAPVRAPAGPARGGPGRGGAADGGAGAEAVARLQHVDGGDGVRGLSLPAAAVRLPRRVALRPLRAAGEIIAPATGDDGRSRERASPTASPSTSPPASSSLLAPLVRKRKGLHKDVMAAADEAGGAGGAGRRHAVTPPMPCRSWIATRCTTSRRWSIACRRVAMRAARLLAAVQRALALSGNSVLAADAEGDANASIPPPGPVRAAAPGCRCPTRGCSPSARSSGPARPARGAGRCWTRTMTTVKTRPWRPPATARAAPTARGPGCGPRRWR